MGHCALFRGYTINHRQNNRSDFMKRNTAKKIAVLALAASFVIGGTSCTLVRTNTKADMAQIIAKVDVTKHEDFKEGGEFAGTESVIKKTNGIIYKRDLIAYFLNTGSNYVSTYGYEQTFTMLLDNLINRKIVVQYAMAWYLNEDPQEQGEYDFSVAGHDAFVESELAAITDEEVLEIMKDNAELLTLKYFITEGGNKPEEYYKAEYTLKKVINDSLDSTEKEYIKEEERVDDTTFGDVRTTPTGVGSEQEDYFDRDYKVYTGHNAASACGSYEKVYGSNQYTRRKAFNKFLTNLTSNSLISENEDAVDFEKIEYYYVELSSQLEQAFIDKFSDELKDLAMETLTQTYVEGKYNELKANQQQSYDKDNYAFGTALASLSDKSFVLYNPVAGYGFVYNILIPFTAEDNQTLDLYKKDTSINGQIRLYQKRAQLLANVKAKDLRAAWFSNNEDNNHSFVASEHFNLTNKEYYNSTYNTGSYLFFEDNMTNNDRYEEIKGYLGKYPYNGTVRTDEDGFVSFKPNALSIDQFIAEMEGYIGYAVGNDAAATGAKTTTYVDDGNYRIENGSFGFDQFMYYKGSVALSDSSVDNYFRVADEEKGVSFSDGHLAASAVNELMFAYSTDTGCFNKYYGYEVSPIGYKSGSKISEKYVPEFAYAAIEAVQGGAGTYIVCATEYGWHIMYVTVAYNQGDVYQGFVWDQREVEGTFSYLWFEALKSATANVRTDKVQGDILGEYNNKTAVKKYKDRYQDLLDLD